MKIDADGHVTMPLQPAFSAYLSNDMAALTASTWTTITFNAERFDQNGDFNSSSSNATINGDTVTPYTFNAPVTGKYLLNVNLYMKTIDEAASFYQVMAYTSNKAYYTIFDPRGNDQDPAYYDMGWSAVVDMDAGDVSYIRIHQSGGAAQMVLDGQSTFTMSLLH
jgi:hypothetical protein